MNGISGLTPYFPGSGPNVVLFTLLLLVCLPFLGGNESPSHFFIWHFDSNFIFFEDRGHSRTPKGYLGATIRNIVTSFFNSLGVSENVKILTLFIS